MTNLALPDCDAVFDKYFARWYDEDDRRSRVYTATRPDVEAFTKRGTPAALASRLTEDGQRQAKAQIDAMARAAESDWPDLSAAKRTSVAWVEAFDDYWTRDRVRDLLDRADPGEDSNDVLVICCEFGAVLGDVMRHELQHLEWLCDRPYWESALLDVPSGYRINVFHWAIKKFSEYGIDDGYGAKVRACLDLVRRGWNA
jgi:hypothetical protein